MFTSIDKAIIAFLGSIVFFISEYTNLEPDFISDELIQSIAAILTTLLVYLVPNKEKK